MYRLLLLFGLSLLFQVVTAQDKKTKVIVIGDNELAWSAAVQSARSGVPTLWLRTENKIGSSFSAQTTSRAEYPLGLNTGLWSEFSEKARSQVSTDSLSSTEVFTFNGQLAQNAFSQIGDSVPGLTKLNGVSIKRLKSAGKRMNVELSNHRKLKITAIVDAGEQPDQQVEALKPASLWSNRLPGTPVSDLYADQTYRTGLISQYRDGRILLSTAGELLGERTQNVFSIRTSGEHRDQLPLLFNLGQVIGASAAYCAFFEVPAEKINIRTLQGELLNFSGQLLPFQDVPLTDPNYAAIQRIGATGLLKGIQESQNKHLYFYPDKTVSSAEIQSTMLALFTRSQIWFRDKQIDAMRLQDLISLMQFTALKGDELTTDIQRRWIPTFRFENEFNLDKKISRRELATLIDFYLQPFSVKVDRNGVFSY